MHSRREILRVLSLIAALAIARHSSADGGLHSSAPSTSLVASDIDSKALWDGRSTYEEFRAANRPKMVKASDARFLVDDEYVLGVTINGQSRAYPTRFAAWHHIINDRFPGDRFVAITFCVVCNTGIAFDPVVDGRPLHLDFYGLYNGVLTMFDHETNTVWLQVGGRGVKGSMLGRKLRTIPILDTTWARWKHLHPDTAVMTPQPYYSRYYEDKGTVLMRGYDRFPAPYFRQTLTHRDHRLPLFSTVLTVTIPAQTHLTASSIPSPDGASVRPNLYRAYPLTTLKKTHGVITESVETTPVAILFEPGSETAVAVSPELDGTVLTLERRAGHNGQFVDRETGTVWNIEGVGISGPLAGRSLTRLDGCLSQWYGWSAYYPQTTIYVHPENPIHTAASAAHLQDHSLTATTR